MTGPSLTARRGCGCFSCPDGGDAEERREQQPGQRHLVIADPHDRSRAQAIVARGFSPVTSLVRRSSLEDVFLRLTGRSLDE